MFLTHARPRARLAASALLAAAALALTACGGDAEGQPDPTASPATSAAAETPTPTPSASPSYKPASADGPAENVPFPKMPEEARERTKAGLEAFTRYWYDLLNYAYESGDVSPIREITETSCKRCGDITQNIEEWHENGRWQVGGTVEIDGTGTEFVSNSAGQFHVSVQLAAEGIRYYTSGGKLEGTSPGTDFLVDVLVAKYEKGNWKTIDIGVAGEI
ncbi:DUF6318 family protein [Arthrobacter sp. USHLN218]|uniref:DUF6318 family protein n=1 Tax=Arthrobacter sp. USHLN218 TaxID=3081232 RepID=UPI003019B11A